LRLCAFAPLRLGVKKSELCAFELIKIFDKFVPNFQNFSKELKQNSFLRPL